MALRGPSNTASLKARNGVRRDGESFSRGPRSLNRNSRAGPSRITSKDDVADHARKPKLSRRAPKEEVASVEDSSNEEEGEDDVTLRTKLDLSGNALPPTEQLVETLSRFPNVQRLDLSDMQASEAAGHPNGLTDLSWIGKAAALAAKRAKKPRNTTQQGDDTAPTFGDRLTWLKVSDNQHLGGKGEDVWEGLERLHKLAVINASSCALRKAPEPPVLMGWSSTLCALILGHNALTELPHFPSMPLLNTIVLSHNQLRALPVDLPANVPALKKLSITHNRLAWDDGKSPLPDFSLCSHLREVRISGNGGLAKLPASLATWGRGVGSQQQGTGLEIFEAADCGLSTFEDIDPLLVSQVDKSATDNVHPDRIRVRGLNLLLLKGNDIASEASYQERLLSTHPSLKVLDNVRLQPKVKKSVPDVEPTDDVTAVAPHGRAGASPIKQHEAAVRKSQSKKLAEKSKAMPPTEMPATSDDTAERKKKHKRGGRGGRSKANETVDDVADAARQPRAPEKKPEKGQANVKASNTALKGKLRRADDEDEHLKRILARAGPSSQEDVPSKASKGQQDKKKRKAWDEGDKLQASQNKPLASKRAKQETRASPEAKEVPVKTSVAGIVEVAKTGKKPKTKSTDAQDEASAHAASTAKPAKTTTWNALRADLSIGQGGAWD